MFVLSFCAGFFPYILFTSRMAGSSSSIQLYKHQLGVGPNKYQRSMDT